MRQPFNLSSKKQEDFLPTGEANARFETAKGSLRTGLSTTKSSPLPAVIQGLPDNRLQLFQSAIAVHFVVTGVVMQDLPCPIDHDKQRQSRSRHTWITELLHAV